MNRKPPSFVKTEKAQWEIDPELAKLGITLSKELPTYDVPVGLIEPTESNPNEMDDDTFNRLVEELEAGIIDPVQIVPSAGGKYKLLAGHHRWRGVKTLGKKTIPCNILTDERFLDEDLHELMMVRMNVIRGKLNPGKFMKMYEDKAKKYGADQLQHLFGYTETDAWKKLTKGVEDAMAKAGASQALLKDLKKRTQKVKTVDGLSAILNQLFREHGEDLQWGFMVFVYGKREHLYVKMDDESKAVLGRVKEWCRKNRKDIGAVLTPWLTRIADELEKRGEDETKAT